MQNYNGIYWHAVSFYLLVIVEGKLTDLRIVFNTSARTLYLNLSSITLFLSTRLCEI